MKRLIALVFLVSGCSDGGTECGRGEVLDAGTCVPAPPSCDPSSATSILESCAVEHRQCFDDGSGAVCGICLAFYREEGARCVAVARCADLGCAAENRECVPATSHTDAFCGECVGGAIEDNDVCAEPSCDAVGTPGSIRETCNALSRVCTETTDGATCGACFVDYVDVDGACVPVQTCLDLGCAEANRVCTASTSHSHASCEGCKAGFREIDGVCQPIPDAVCDPAPAAGSILAECDAENRNCVIRTSGAQCGGCKDGFNENPDTGACETPVICADLDCDSQHRACVAEPNGHCTGCLSGYVEDSVTGDCRTVHTCADITCDNGEDCAEATANADAFCRPDCGDAAIWGGTRCEPCPPCDGPGEVGRWPWPSATGACICETAPGYFYSLSADVGPFRCDADGDGWVRESARISIESADLALRLNARCDLAVVDRVRFIAEGGSSAELLLEGPLPLFESDRNDDDTILNAIWDVRNFPPWGRRLKAAELNRLTKVCHDLRMDYNDNGAADVTEWGDMTLGPTMRPEQKPFNQLSYFVELHRGWFESPTSGRTYGTYEIAEKSRSASPTIPGHQKVSLQYAPNDGTHWRQCEVRRDSDWQTQGPPIGMDMAKYADLDQWTGMNHHSQFKCLIADPDPDGSIATQLSPLQMFDGGYRLNRCQATGDPVSHDGNPSEPLVDCDYTTVETLEPGDVVWGGVPYIDHGQWVSKEYVRGCFNECVEGITECPGYDINPRAVNCLYDPSNFGEFVSCSVWEVCDGQDNNQNGVVDEGDPEGNQECDTGELGRCSFGTTHCIAGVLECFRDNGPISELCNGVDDNCDGDTDENDPEGGVIDCDTGEEGVCAAGKRHCENGGLSRCDRVQDPQDENHLDRGCNHLDDDCDGEVDEAPEYQCGEPWGTYYVDTDKDGQGDKNDLGTCMCPYQAETQDVSDNKNDCCDSDDTTFLGASGWHTSRNECQSFDYDCSGIEEKHYESVPDPGCGICAFCGCYSSANGWKQAPVPYCGESAAYYTHCNWVCSQKTSSRTQECK
jgi:hypothetical protein